MQFKTKDIKIEIKANLEKNEIEAYASTWDKDLGNDTIVKGAFKKTIAERFSGGQKRDIKVLWQHDMSAPIGLPIHMEEDSTGLLTVSKISNTPLGRDAMQLALDGVIDKMSIGYDVIQSKDDGQSGRILSELKLYEYSMVTFPMNEKAGILQAKDLKMTEHLWRLMQKAGVTDLAQLVKQTNNRGVKAMSEELLAALNEAIASMKVVADLAAEEMGTDPEASTTEEDDELEKSMNALKALKFD